VKKDRPHTLIVEAIEDGLDPPVEYRVIHPPTCPWDAYRRSSDPFLHDEPDTDPREWIFVRACLTEYEVAAVGMDAVCTPDGREWPLPPGRYRLTTESVYYPGEFGGTWGAEWDVEMTAEPLTEKEAA
jgi:hypothetical protein